MHILKLLAICVKLWTIVELRGADAQFAACSPQSTSMLIRVNDLSPGQVARS